MATRSEKWINMARVLITPLDWGLGHASRCIPIIRKMLELGHRVDVGSSGPALSLLREEFPRLNFLELPSYNPRYPAKAGMVWKMSLQLPKFINVIRSEHDVVTAYVREHGIDLVISDNRYGCWSPDVRSVFITHQSNVLMPRRFGWLGRWVRSTNESLLRRFDVCWIPDYPGEHSLAGDLVSFGGIRFTGKLDFIGSLSRFKAHGLSVRKYDILAVCSGPEPQRSLLEALLLPQLRRSGKRFLLVRGVIEEGGEGEVVNFLTTEKLGEAIASSDVVIARSGYSTIMDLQVLEKKAIFIPTPGQTEQEYLAARLKERKVAFSMDQDNFDLRVALRESDKYAGFSMIEREDLLTPALLQVLGNDR